MTTTKDETGALEEALCDGRSRGRKVWRTFATRIDDLLVEYSAANNAEQTAFNDGAIQALARLKARLDDDARASHVDGSEI
jgi:hypothetical protein